MLKFLCLVVGLTAVLGARTEPVATRMHNVTLHLGKGVVLRISDLSGHLIGSADGPVLFDDVNSYLVSIDSARVAMDAESLTNLMNNHVFAYKGAPLKDLKVSIEGGEMKQSGTLVKGVGVPFSMRATIAATSDGRLRIHSKEIKAAGFVPKGVLDFFGLELERLVKLDGTRAVTIEGDDLLLDPEHLLPPPRIKGRLAHAWIENGLVVEEFGTGARLPTLKPPGNFANYMYYRGGRLRFGKLTMDDTDLILVDEDPKDPFDFSPERYNDQLVAGYSKNTRSHGLITYMPDLEDLGRGRPARHQ